MASTAADATITVHARRDRGGTVIAELAGTEPWRPRILGAVGGIARVALVQSRASLLAGDRVSLAVDVEPGCALEILELGATVVHHVRGGAGAGVEVRVRVGRDARLIWLGAPLIAAGGCDVRRSTRVELAAGAAVLFGEALVLGRAAEEPGRASVHTRIELEGRPVLDETLDTDPAWRLRSDVVAGPGRMIAGLTLAGLRDRDPPGGVFGAHEPASLWRSVGPAHAAPTDELIALERRWRRLLLAVVASSRAVFGGRP